MTTFQIRTESRDLADALTVVADRCVPDHEAWAGAMAMSHAARPGNGKGQAADPVTWGCRGLIAQKCRELAGEDHPLGAELTGLADALDQSVAARG